MKILSLFNQKGGVAKTTSTVNVASFLARDGYKVLVIDADAQGNSSNYLSCDNDKTIVDYLKGECGIEEIVYEAEIETKGGAKPKAVGIDVIPSDRSLYGYEMEIDFYKSLIKSLKKSYDYIIFDCPPALNSITLAVMCAVEKVFIPISVDIDSMNGYKEILTTIENINEEGYNNVSVGGAFLTSLVPSGAYDKYIVDVAKDVFGDDLLDTYIRRCADVKASRHFCRPLAWFKTGGNAAQDYKALTDEIKSIMSK